MINPDPETLADRVRRLRKGAGLSQSSLARQVGVRPQSIQALEAGKVSNPKYIVKLAIALGVTANYMESGKEDSESKLLSVSAEAIRSTPHLVNAEMASRAQIQMIRIPVYGQVVGGKWGEFSLDGIKMFDVMAPPTISKIKDAYAVVISGDTMYPRYNDGEIAFVDPSRTPRKGDYVVAQIRDGDGEVPLAFVKKFVSRTSEELVLEQLNPPEILNFSGSRVLTVHTIVLSGYAPDQHHQL